MDVNGQKMQTDIKVVHGDQMGSRGGDEWKQGGSGGKLTSLGNVEARKQTTAPKKCTNQAIHWDANSVFLNKNAAHETRKNKAENNQQQRSATNGTQDNNNWKPANKTHSVKPTRKQCKRGSPTTRICNIKQVQNVSISTIKCMKECMKPMQKIRQARNYICNAEIHENMKRNKQQIAQDVCVSMV